VGVLRTGPVALQVICRNSLCIVRCLRSAPACVYGRGAATWGCPRLRSLRDSPDPLSEDTPSRPHATTTPIDPLRTPTRRDDSRYDATERPEPRYAEPPIAPLFHSKSLNCNLWYLLDLLSNKAFDIAPLSIELAPSPTRSYLAYKVSSNKSLDIAPFPLSSRLHQQDPLSHTKRDHISRPTATTLEPVIFLAS
jgi:hypothetical protein